MVPRRYSYLISLRILFLIINYQLLITDHKQYRIRYGMTEKLLSLLLSCNRILISKKVFGQLVLLGFDITAFTPAAYLRSSLLRPLIEISS